MRADGREARSGSNSLVEVVRSFVLSSFGCVFPGFWLRFSLSSSR